MNKVIFCMIFLLTVMINYVGITFGEENVVQGSIETNGEKIIIQDVFVCLDSERNRLIIYLFPEKLSTETVKFMKEDSLINSSTELLIARSTEALNALFSGKIKDPKEIEWDWSPCGVININFDDSPNKNYESISWYDVASFGTSNKEVTLGSGKLSIGDIKKYSFAVSTDATDGLLELSLKCSYSTKYIPAEINLDIEVSKKYN